MIFCVYVLLLRYIDVHGVDFLDYFPRTVLMMLHDGMFKVFPMSFIKIPGNSECPWVTLQQKWEKIVPKICLLGWGKSVHSVKQWEKISIDIQHLKTFESIFLPLLTSITELLVVMKTYRGNVFSRTYAKHTSFQMIFQTIYQPRIIQINYLNNNFKYWIN